MRRARRCQRTRSMARREAPGGPRARGGAAREHAAPHTRLQPWPTRAEPMIGAPGGKDIRGESNECQADAGLRSPKKRCAPRVL